MPRFAANLSLLFTEYPMLERPAAAARAGFEAVEVQFPYAWPAPEWAAALQAAGLPMVLHNLPAGDWAAGERGIACHPGREAAFREGVAQALAYARILGVRQLNCLAGIVPAGVSDAQARATLVANLRFAAQACAPHGVRVLIEPINGHDVPGFWLQQASQALSVIDEVGAGQVWLQHDLYHAQRSTGELAATLERCIGRIGHIQIADNPGRHEPGTGEIHYPFLFDLIDRLGYDGWVGAEYLPRAGTESGLGWLWMQQTGQADHRGVAG